MASERRGAPTRCRGVQRGGAPNQVPGASDGEGTPDQVPGASEGRGPPDQVPGAAGQAMGALVTFHSLLSILALKLTASLGIYLPIKLSIMSNTSH